MSLFPHHQCIVNPDTQEPTDDLTPEAIKIIQALGSTATKVSEVIENQDRAIFTAIQEGIDRANEGAVSNAQKVSCLIVIFFFYHWWFCFMVDFFFLCSGSKIYCTGY